MKTEARERWRAALDAWAIPESLLDAVADDPYEWPAHLHERATRAAVEPGTTWPTLEIVKELAGRGGSVIDVGAGAGRLAVPLARAGHRVTAVERDEGMVKALTAQVAEARVEITKIVGSWPTVAGNAGRHDVATSSNVVFDVPSIGPFLDAMRRSARRWVVVEMTERHPWAGLSGYLERLHGLRRPTGPTVSDFVAVVEEMVGIEPEIHRWRSPVGMRFADLTELLAFYRRRLLVPPDRSVEAAGLLEPDVRRTGDGWLVLGDAERPAATVWWPAR